MTDDEALMCDGCSCCRDGRCYVGPGPDGYGDCPTNTLTTHLCPCAIEEATQP